MLNQDASVASGETPSIENQAPSVKVIKIIDSNVAAAAPTITAQVPSAANAGETIRSRHRLGPTVCPQSRITGISGTAPAQTAPRRLTPTRERQISLSAISVEGVDGVSAGQSFSIKVTGNLRALPSLNENRRFVEPTDR